MGLLDVKSMATLLKQIAQFLNYYHETILGIKTIHGSTLVFWKDPFRNIFGCTNNS